MTLIQIKDLSLGYEGRCIVQNLNFSVEKGDYLCIVGENGSGKSTLIRTLLGLQEPMGGTVEFSDGLSPKSIGYLPQTSAHQLHFPASVQEVVLSGRLNQLGFFPVYRKADREAACRAMEELGIQDLTRRSFGELSGGQKQRVLLARALCAASSLLLLDEPAAGLDPVVMQEMYALIHRIRKERGMGILMVSHDISAAVRDADHILHLDRYETFFGTKEEYLHSDFARRFLGGPENV